MRIAYAGAKGAFAHEACLAFARDLSAVAVPDFGAVLAAVERGEAAAGMLPVRNSRAGEVEEVSRLLPAADVEVERLCPLPVRMHLLGLAGAELSGLEAVTSHPIALRQCARSLERLGLEGRPATNTALAAKELSEPSIGVLASEAAARAYGLKVLRHDMQDDPDNMTVFAVVRRRSN